MSMMASPALMAVRTMRGRRLSIFLTIMMNQERGRGGDGCNGLWNQWRSRRTESVPDLAVDDFVLAGLVAFGDLGVFVLLADFVVEVLDVDAGERRVTLLFEVRRAVEAVVLRAAFASSLTFGPSTPSGVGYS